MHLESLTLRGFKSFAASTTLRFEPGITAVVGPNGSGKSNVVDAIAWVLGEQGAKSLRGGKMEDVIFAGTSGRPPLGRAEVILTIDNSDGALPIEAAQVTISRLMYRSGVSEYAINGTTCRLLDVQELLSDSGIGREMHVIVGQGQLDAVLQSRPEDRRAYIEEAAGVLKHRKRKEKALRKLEAMQGNLDRLTDLTAELGRQLGPLGRQAEVARRASTIQADLRDARLRLIADDAVTLADALAAEAADEQLIRTRRAEVERDAGVIRQELAELEAAVARDATATSAAADVYYRLVGIRDRLASLVTLAGERASHLDQVQLTTTGPDPDELDADAARHGAEAAALADDLATARTALTDAGAQRAEAESALAAHDAAERDAARRQADRRERRARLTGRLDTARMKASAATAEVQRLAAARDEARARADAARASFAELESGLAGLDEGEEDLDQSFESAAAALAAAEADVAELDAAARAGEADRARAEARRDAIALTLTRKDGAAALAAAGGPVLGALFQRISVADGASAALAAALGPVADAVLVDSVRSAVDSMAALRRTSGGRATLLVAGSTTSNPPPAPPGGISLASLISGDAGAVSAIAPLVERVAVVDTLADAERFVSAHPDWRAATRDGDLVGPSLSTGGSDDQPSLLALQADHDDAVRAVDGAIAAREQALFALAAANSRLADARTAHDEALSRLHDSDARLAAIAEQLGALSSTARAATAEAERLETARTRAAETASAAGAEAGELEALVAQADADADQPEVVDPEVRGQLATRLERARSHEVDARLAVSSLTERQRSAADRAAALARQAEAERAARRAAEEAAEQRRMASLRAHEVVRRGRAILTRLAAAVEAGLSQRVAVDAARVAHEHALVAVRARHAEVTAELDSLTVAEHRDEMARTESRLRLEALLQRAMDEFGVDADDLRANYAPDVPVPPSEEDGEPGSYDRAEQETRARKAERALAQLGRINPLAMEEFDALTERHRFLSAQLDDLKTTRRDLLTVIKEVDERVEQVFTEAFADTAREFETVFSTLFPGGEGHLLLTDPSNMATTGVEVTARPAGKTVQRLSLLSGGERSLTALALLVAIFRARPSPFYVLDEVEAALDGPNLGRLVGLFAELRGTSQLIVITHQTRTMEAADALYGVTMRGDGVSQVVSARLRDRADASAPAAS